MGTGAGAGLFARVLHTFCSQASAKCLETALMGLSIKSIRTFDDIKIYSSWLPKNSNWRQGTFRI